MGRGSDTVQLLFQATVWHWLALAAALAVMIWVIVRVRARFRGDEDLAADAHRMLSQFRDLRREGSLSDEEFRSIKGQLMERIDGSDRAQDAGPPESSGSPATRQQPPPDPDSGLATREAVHPPVAEPTDGRENR